MKHACPEGAPGGGEDQLRFGVAPIQGPVPVPAPAAQGLAKAEMRRGKESRGSELGLGLVSWIIAGSGPGRIRGQGDG